MLDRGALSTTSWQNALPGQKALFLPPSLAVDYALSNTKLQARHFERTKGLENRYRWKVFASGGLLLCSSSYRATGGAAAEQMRRVTQRFCVRTAHGRIVGPGPPMGPAVGPPG